MLFIALTNLQICMTNIVIYY